MEGFQNYNLNSPHVLAENAKNICNFICNTIHNPTAVNLSCEDNITCRPYFETEAYLYDTGTDGNKIYIEHNQVTDSDITITVSERQNFTPKVETEQTKFEERYEKSVEPLMVFFDHFFYCLNLVLVILGFTINLCLFQMFKRITSGLRAQKSMKMYSKYQVQNLILKIKQTYQKLVIGLHKCKTRFKNYLVRHWHFNLNYEIVTDHIVCRLNRSLRMSL